MKMEDQGKRLLLAVAIAFGIMMLWTVVFPPDKAEKKPPAPVADPAAAVAPAASTAPTQPGATAPAAPGAAPTAPVVRGEEVKFEFPFEDVHATFSSWGGALQSWQLLGDQFHVPGDESVPEDLVRLAAEHFYPFTVRFAEGSTHQIPPGAEWKGQKTNDSEMVFTWESAELKVTKTFRLKPEHYLVELDVDYQVLKGAAKQTLIVTTYSQQDPKKAKKGGWTELPREWKAACYVDGDLSTHSAKAVMDRERGERGEVTWAGFIHSYFLAAAAPRAEQQVLDCRAYSVGKSPGGMGVDIVYPLKEIPEGNSLKAQLVAYMGPKYLNRLEAIPGVVDYDPGFEKAVDLGFWGFIAGPLLWIMQQFYGFVGSWGIAIILLTMVVKLATLYWTHKSMKSMRAMAKLKPKLEEIRKKHGNDKQKQQIETMNLFKAHGVNPLAGCLPILLQMPIWFALYRALSVAAELYQAEFLWFDDLTAPDPYFILPVFMTITMLLQSKLTPQTTTGMQQKILTWGMPLMFGGFSLFFPAGLTLYISTNTVLSLFHHLYMRRDEIFAKNDPATGKVEALAEETKSEPVKAAADDDDGDDDEPHEAPKTSGNKNGHSARPKPGQQRRRSNKRSKRGSRSS